MILPRTRYISKILFPKTFYFHLFNNKLFYSKSDTWRLKTKMVIWCIFLWNVKTWKTIFLNFEVSSNINFRLIKMVQVDFMISVFKNLSTNKNKIPLVIKYIKY